jgi:hypothetical protein
MSGSFVAGFWSYVHEDNKHDNGRIQRLSARLESSIRFYSGIRDFRIFLDRKDIGWGEKWASRIAESIDDSLLLFPITTPSYFSSVQCREEFLAFQRRQTNLNRDDLILPIYYVSTELMAEGNDRSYKAEEAEVASLLRSSQYEDWRSLRVTEETDRSYANAIERMAQQATKALRRDHPVIVVKSSDSPLSSVDRPERENEDTAAEMVSPTAAPGVVVTFTVHQMPGRGQFTTITEAIARAPSGAKIVVAQGHYRESIVINKPLGIDRRRQSRGNNRRSGRSGPFYVRY